MSAVSFTKTEKGKTKACHGGYLHKFEKNSKIDETIGFWQCEEYWSERKCRARIHVCQGHAIKFVGRHNHAHNGQRKKVLDTLIYISAVTGCGQVALNFAGFKWPALN